MFKGMNSQHKYSLTTQSDHKKVSRRLMLISTIAAFLISLLTEHPTLLLKVCLNLQHLTSIPHHSHSDQILLFPFCTFNHAGFHF
jgi:hypothetical protein